MLPWLSSTVWVLLTVGCQQEGLPHFGTLQYESESFEVWASDGLEACGGTFEYTERWLAAFRARVGEHGNPIEHEIVHTELDAQPPSVLAEGAAEVFGSIESPYMTEVTDLDPLLDAEQISGFGYQTAGRFSRFIIERHGLDAYFALYKGLAGAAGREAFASGVEATLGVELPALVEGLEQSSPCSVDRWRHFDHECSTLPLTPWDDPTRWAEQIELSCSTSNVIGPRRGSIWTLRALEVEQTGSYQLTIASTDKSAQVAILPCNADCFDGEPVTVIPSASVATGGRASVFLEAGRHFMRVEHANSSDASVLVALEP